MSTPVSAASTITGETGRAVTETLAAVGMYDEDADTADSEAFDQTEHESLEDFYGLNNFQDHPLLMIKDALVRGWDDGKREVRIVDAICHRLQHYEQI